MKTEDLVAIGLEESQISEVFKLRGKEIEDSKAKYTLLEVEKANIEKELSEDKGKLEAVKDDYVSLEDFNELQTTNSNLEGAIQSLKEDHVGEITGIKYDTLLNKHLSEAGVKSNYTDLAKSVLDKDSIKFIDGALEGIDEALKLAKENYGDLFAKPAESKRKFTGRQNVGGVGYKTKEDIMNIKDDAERLNAIIDNPDKFK